LLHGRVQDAITSDHEHACVAQAPRERHRRGALAAYAWNTQRWHGRRWYERNVRERSLVSA
jgi:hypothetical protein